ncbi:hypothetical protein [Tenacibaculum ascidiaceicola]|uniref:hypothetical protein n=1 Tax=Tenacibaculum ascidiaceicola TaxID=1699411 RepID=UPI0039E3A018
MKRKITLLIFTIMLLKYNFIYTQNKSVFEIKEILIERPKTRKYHKVEFVEKEKLLEDESYLITKSCSGEWGGSIWFKSKKSGIVYSCQSTCVKSINKINGKYLITNSLSHMNGYSEIIIIDDPKKLEQHKKSSVRKDKKGYSLLSVRELESKSRIGVNVIWSKQGILTILSFLYKNTLYHIMDINDDIFITTIKNSKIVVVDKFSTNRIWSHHTLDKISDNHIFLYLRRNFQKDEYIEIKDNKIKLVTYK